MNDPRLAWRRAIPAIVLAITFVLLPTRDADAYIDPGSSSYFLQSIIGGVAAALVLLKTYRRRMTGFFRRPHASDDSEMV